MQLEFLAQRHGETSANGDQGSPAKQEMVKVQGALKGGNHSVEYLPLYKNKDTVKGLVKVIPIPGKRVEHLGIRVQLVGEIVLASDKGHPHEILSLVRDLAPPGELMSQQVYPFEFKSVEMEYESYRGSQVTLRYSVRVIVARSMGQSLIQDHFFEVQNPVEACEMQNNGGNPIKMEVGIEDCLHIEFEYGRSAYHLKDTVIGKINFMLVRIKLKHMEVEIKRRETVGGGMNARLESTPVAKFEIMDGAPARGESIPIRLYLAPYNLTPSYDNVHNKFGVRYSINLVLVDEEDRRYFKQQDITLYRLKDDALGGEVSWDFISDSMTHYLDDGQVAEETLVEEAVVESANDSDGGMVLDSEPEVVQTEDQVLPEKPELLNEDQKVEEEVKEKDGAPDDIEFGDVALEEEEEEEGDGTVEIPL